MHRAIRLASVVTLLAGIALYLYRGQRTPEQEELRSYVEVLLPRLGSTEDRVDDMLRKLQVAPGLPPPAARALLVDEVIPTLIALRAQASERTFQTSDVVRLQKAYDEVVLGQIEACRTAVRVIDDSKLDTKTAMARVQKAFADAATRRQQWKQQLQATSASHGMLTPVRR